MSRLIVNPYEDLLRKEWGKTSIIRLEAAMSSPMVSWAGRCSLCHNLNLTADDPKKAATIRCGYGDRMGCMGTAVLLPDWESVVAAYLIGGWEAAAKIS